MRIDHFLNGLLSAVEFDHGAQWRKTAWWTQWAKLSVKEEKKKFSIFRVHKNVQGINKNAKI